MSEEKKPKRKRVYKSGKKGKINKQKEDEKRDNKAKAKIEHFEENMVGLKIPHDWDFLSNLIMRCEKDEVISALELLKERRSNPSDIQKIEHTISEREELIRNDPTAKRISPQNASILKICYETMEQSYDNPKYRDRVKIIYDLCVKAIKIETRNKIHKLIVDEWAHELFFVLMQNKNTLWDKYFVLIRRKNSLWYKCFGNEKEEFWSSYINRCAKNLLTNEYKRMTKERLDLVWRDELEELEEQGKYVSEPNSEDDDPTENDTFNKKIS